MKKIRKVMIAAPLFTPYERETNNEMACFLEREGYETFLPQRDGRLLQDIIKELKSAGKNHEEATKISNRLISHSDAYNAYERCDAVVVNLNGRVPDEGALIEGAMAFCARHPVILYKADSRSLIMGQDNPLILLLSDRIVKSYGEIVDELKRYEKMGTDMFEGMLMGGREISKKTLKRIIEEL